MFPSTDSGRDVRRSLKDMIDLHNHLLPAVDDGAVDLAEARQAVVTMYGQGVRGIVVTPHVRASVLFRPAEAAKLVAVLDEAWKALLNMRNEEFPDLILHHGTELMLDHPNPTLAHDWLRLAGTRFVLVEFPGMQIPQRAAEALASLVQQEYTPVLAHPERYRNAGSDCMDIAAWREFGTRLQVNCGSLLGYYGADAYRRAWTLLQNGAIDYLASDYHARGRCPIAACEKALLEEDATLQSELLLRTNPGRLLAGEDPVEVPPAEVNTSTWKRIVRKGRFWSL